jgi:hypothetical protein
VRAFSGPVSRLYFFTVTGEGESMFATQKFFEERDLAKKRKAATERQRKCQARKLLVARQESDDPLRYSLQQIYREQNFNILDFISLNDFFRLSGLDPVNLDRVKSIDKARVFRNGEIFEVVRPKYLL